MKAVSKSVVVLFFFLLGCSSSKPARVVDPELSRAALSARRAFDRGQVEHAARLYTRSLTRARSMDDAAEIANNAYNLAACEVVRGDYEKARVLLEEARGEFAREGEAPADIDLLQAKIALREGDPDSAGTLIAYALQREDPPLTPSERLDFIVLQARGALNRGDIAAARAGLDEARDRLEDDAPPLQRAGVAGLSGEVLLAEGEFEPAAKEFDRQAGFLQEGGRYREMALANKRAGEAYRGSGKPGEAADRFFRAARSLFARGETLASLRVIEDGLASAEAGGARILREKIVALFEEIKTTVESAAE